MEDREKRKIIAEEKHKEWVQKKNEQVRRKKGTHVLYLAYSLHPITPSHYLCVSHFLLDFFFSGLVSAPFPPHPSPLPTKGQLSDLLSFALCSLSLFHHVASIWMRLQVVMKSVISRPGLQEHWIFVSSVGRHLWACKSKTTHFYPFSSDRTIVLTPWFLILV